MASLLTFRSVALLSKIRLTKAIVFQSSPISKSPFLRNQPTLSKPTFYLSAASLALPASSLFILQPQITPCEASISVPEPPQSKLIIPSKTASTTSKWKSFLSKARRYLSAILRYLRIGLAFSPLLILTPLSYALPFQPLHDLNWTYSKYAIQSLGPTFIKLSQWASTRRDLFSKTMCDKLSTLHSGTKLHPWEWTHQTLLHSYGPDYEVKLGINKDSQMLGSGAVAQVYKGKLPNGEPIAIKIIHPNLKRMIENDIQLMEMCADLIHGLPGLNLKWFALPEAVAEFKSIMEDQLDLRVEAANLKKFGENFKVYTNEAPKVVFPRAIEGMSTEDVLVESFEHGMQISELFQASPEFRKGLAKPLVRAFLKMVFTDNLIHCDLHPGNVLVRREEGSPHCTLVILDVGIALTLAPDDQQNLKDLFRAVVFNDGETAGRLIVKRAKRETCSQTPGGVDKFSKEIGDIINEFHANRKSGGLTLGSVKIGTLLSRVLDLCRTHGVLLEPSMANVVLSTLVLEGLGRSLDPDANLISAALPFLMGRGGL